MRCGVWVWVWVWGSTYCGLGSMYWAVVEGYLAGDEMMVGSAVWKDGEWKRAMGAEDGEETSTLGRVGYGFGISLSAGCVCDTVGAEFGCDGVFSVVEG